MRASLTAGARAILFGAAAFVVATAAAQPAPEPLSPAEQRELETVALARARTQLLERISAMPLGSEHTVATWLMQDVDLDRALRLWVRSRPRHGNARTYGDQTCEADVRLEAADLAARLVELLEQHPQSAAPLRLTAEGIRSAARQWPSLQVTGRAELTRDAARGQPPGWEDVSHEGQELARGAATADAYAALLSEAGRLKMTATRRLDEFLGSSPPVRDAVRAELQRVAKTRVEFAPDQIAVVEARISLRDLIKILVRVYQEVYRGTEFEETDFSEMVLYAGTSELAATGLASPPLQTRLPPRPRTVDLDVPEWAATTLTAVGRYEPAEGEVSEAEARREAARLDGIDRLWQQLEKLVIQKDVTVAAFLSYHQELKPDVAVFLGGARAVGNPRTLPGGTVEVQVELPLRRLWEIVRRKMRLEEVEPPAEATSQPGEPPPGEDK